MPKGQLSPDQRVETEQDELSRFDELAIGASDADLVLASEWLEATCRQHDVPQDPAERLALCLYEVLANIVTHGGESARAAPIRLLFEVRLDPDCMKAGVTVSDAGAAFNPLSIAPITPPNSLDEAVPGGLGLLMIRRCADWLDYRHEDGRNHFTFGARWNRQ
jgi:anti-sigma regulatory factor (Ser/Thr protein kinase)